MELSLGLGDFGRLGLDYFGIWERLGSRNLAGVRRDLELIYL